MNLQQAFDETIQLLHEVKDKDGQSLRMKSLTVSASEQYFEYFFTGDEPSTDLRSVSKVILALTVGAVVEQSWEYENVKISLNSDIGQLARRIDRLSSIPGVEAWEGVELAHLLSNTIGHEEGFFFRKDIGERDGDELLRYVFGVPVRHKAGTHFSYSNAGPYVVSVLFQEMFGRRFSDIAAELVLQKLDISNFEWRQYGSYDAGCSGLVFSARDLAKVGRMLKDGGIYSGRQVVPRAWCRLMSTPFTRTPAMYDPTRVFPKFAYGLGLWVCEDGRYYCDGTNGQYLIVIPDKDMLITTLGDQPDMKPITRCLLPLLGKY